MRHLTKAAVQLVKSVFNRRSAVQISRRPYFFSNRPQRNSFAKHLFDEGASRPALLPREVRREGSRIDIFEFARRTVIRMAHRTFATTSVRSSESGALWVNQSTSRKMRSAISVAAASWCCSINLRSRSVPKNRSEEHT